MSPKEPFVRITRRESPFTRALLIRIAAFVLALIVSALIIVAIIKVNPVKVYGSMLDGAFGSKKRSWITIRDAMTLLCIAVALAPAFKMRFWNIGAEGQILVGGLATSACIICLGGSVSLPLLFLLMIVTSLLAGAVWGLIPALFKARWNTNETLFTLMMNYVAIQLTSYFVAKWEHPYGSNTVGIIPWDNSKVGWLPNMFSHGFNTDYGWNVLIVLAVTVLMFIYLKYSKQGYEIAVVGESENTARYAGISVPKVYIRTMLISGAVAGLAGFIAVSGASHTISTSTAGGRGFTAIIVAWLAKFNTFTMIVMSFLLVALEKGAAQIASDYGFNDYASEMVTGIILFFILGSEFFINYRLVFRGSARKEAE
ncbi:MAG: ABC transporter permease [Oscillospiraceae bacterium]|nr:ABC transporter permease [Oscillospiraceae bacterium]